MALKESNTSCHSTEITIAWHIPRIQMESITFHQNTSLFSFISKQNLFNAVDIAVKMLLKDE